MHALRTTLVALALVSTSGCFHWQVRSEAEQTFTYTAENDFSQVEIESASGDVRVHAKSGAAFSVVGRVHAWSVDKTRAQAVADQVRAAPPIERSGDLVRIGRTRSASWSEGYSIDYDITLPSAVQASVFSASGDVEVTGVEGEVKVDSASGQVTVNGAGAARVNSASGDVTLREIAGDLEVDSSSGDVRIEATPSAQSQWQVDVSSGDVTMTVAPTAAFHFDASTSSGAVSSGLPLRIQGRIDSDALHGEVGNSENNARVKVRTSSGDLRLR